MIKLTIIGYGNVGKAISLLLLGSSHELHLNIMDPAADKSGIFLDLQHAWMSQENKKLSINDSAFVENSDFIFFTAGVPNTAGGSRLEKVEDNKKVVQEVFGCCSLKSSVKIIAITNPVDIITSEIIRVTGLPWNQVVGTGTFLDSLRLKFYLSKLVNVSSAQLKTVILGEHGATQVPMRSLCTFESKPIMEHLLFTDHIFQQAAESTRNAAAEIRKTEPGTSIAVTQCAVKIVEFWLSPTEVMIPLSVKLDDSYNERFNVKKDLCISVPVSISKKGIQILPIPNFMKSEEKAFKQSIEAISPFV